MPKQTLTYRDFSGGENTSANPKVIKQNQLQLLQGMFVDEMGYLTTFYPPQKSPNAAQFKDFGMFSGNSLYSGNGLFYFKSDVQYDNDGNYNLQGPYHYIALVNSVVYDNGALKSMLTLTDGNEIFRDVIQLGTTRSFVPEYYFHSNILRISDKLSTAGDNQGQYWLGPILGSSGATKKILGAEINKRWYSELNNLTSPTYGLAGRLTGVGHTDSDTTSVIPVRITDLAGTATIADNSGVVRFSATGHGMSDGDTVIISDSEYYSGSHTIVNKATDTFEIDKVWLAVATGETPEWRRKGDPDWFSGFTTSVAAAHAANKPFIEWQFGGTTLIQRITVAADNDLTIESGTQADGVLFEVYPTPGVGMNLDVYQSRGSDKGAWPPGDYEFGQTFVYNNNQESLITKMSGDDVTIDANEVLYCKVFVSGLNVDAADPNTTGAGGNSDINPRIEKGRIYTRKSGTGDEWILLVDADLRTANDATGGGTRLNLTDSLDSWSVKTAADGDDIDGNVDSTQTRWRGFNSTQYTIKSPSPFTYEAINGFSQDEPVLTFGASGLSFKTSVICNSRTFVANIDYYDSTMNLKNMGDAIIYSPPNKMDTFPPSYRLDIAEGDGDEFVKLMESSGKLLAFKKSTLFIIDVTNPNPAGWRLENKFVGLGVNHSCSVIRVENGVAFVNYNGCWIYQNNQLNDLIIGKASVSQWQNFIGASNNNPNIGYDSTSKKLIIVHNNENVSKYLKFYDLITGSWSRSYGDGTAGDKGIKYFMNYGDITSYDIDNNQWSNFITIPDSTTNFTAGHGSKGAGAVVFVREDDNYNTNIITNAVDINFTDTSNWEKHQGAGTVTFANSSTSSQYLAITGDSNTGEQGAKLLSGHITTTPVVGVTYRVSINLWWNSSPGTTDKVFKVKFGGATSSAFAVTGTSSTTTYQYITATSTTKEIYVFYNHASTTQWFIDEVIISEAKDDLRWFALKRNVIDYSNAIVDGDTKANRSLYNIVTREEDFGNPFGLKKIYSVTIDYITENANGTFTFDLRYQINGNIQNSDLGTDWMAATSSPLIVDNQSTTGLATPNEVNTIKIPYSSFSGTGGRPIKCHSIAFQIHNSDGVTRQFVKILNIGVEYRSIKKSIGTEITAVNDASL